MAFLKTAAHIRFDHDIHKIKSFIQMRAIREGATSTDLLDIYLVNGEGKVSTHPRYVLMVDVEEGPKIIDLKGE